MRQIARSLFILLLVIGTILISVTTDWLPAQIASHFGAGGAPNGWMSRNGYLLFMLAFAVGLPLVVVLSMGILPRRMEKRISIPNRDFWLDPSRRETTFAYLETHAYWLGSLLVVFIAAIHLLVIEANATHPPRLPGQLFGALIALFLVALAAWMLTLVLRFRHKS